MVNVNIIDIFSGPRHDRLNRCWDRFAERHADRMRLFRYPNRVAQIPHQIAMKAMLAAEMDRPDRYAIITEHDFLPALDFDQFAPVPLLGPSPMVIAEALRRGPDRKLIHYGPDLTAPWYILIDKTRIRWLHTLPGGPLNDTANLAGKFCKIWYKDDPVVLSHKDCYPDHFGASLLTGVHLFWSRHYNDPPERDLCGYPCSEIMSGVDRAISSWETKFDEAREA